MFEFRPDWHRASHCLPLVRQYHAAIDVVLETHPHRPLCAVHCRHCGIRFLTHACNAQRENLLCPFGCREHSRRQAQRERSQRHYRTQSGWLNKKQCNLRRAARCQPPPECAAATEIATAAMRAAPDDLSPATPPLHTVRHASCDQVDGELRPVVDTEQSLEQRLAGSPLLPYLTVLVSLIVNRVVRREELLASLVQSVRQRSLGGRWPIDYVSLVRQQHPP